ncbi:MAG TPA: cyclic pyranopterin monophosphate synthase MoaC [Gemmatimonadales bacterium]|nr:cyclic pyranopterin monophosphate synthase MoaC [Gemmatimonadales bacterium]
MSHLGPGGDARMVDVSGKEVTDRLARAEGAVRMSSAAFELVRTNAVAKGDVLAVGRLAGIQAAKRTAELIPLCHPLPLDQIEVELSLDPSLPGVRIAAQARTAAKTGVEMEALTAVAVASLTIYDMVKSADRAMSIEAIRLTHKAGGRSGEYVAPDAGPLKEDR